MKTMKGMPVRFTQEQAKRMDDFLAGLERLVYPENPSPLHSEITRRAIKRLAELYPLNGRTRVLDIGCGQGPALAIFQEMGVPAVGITLGEEDLAECRTRGYTVARMDQSFLDFDNDLFDVVWARHVVEHSVFPLFTLHGFSKVLKPGGILYLEVPAPDTDCHHERNPNHYSVLTQSAWISLLQRAGFTVIEVETYSFTCLAGDDYYWGFFCTLP